MKITNDLELYESNEYVDNYHQDGGNRVEQILKSITLAPSDNVVDYACGNGLLAVEIANKVKSYTGVDFSSLFIKKAEQISSEHGLNNVSFVCGDIIEFASTNQSSFDKAFSLDFTEHLNDENLKLIFTAIKSSLKDDGELIIHTPNGDYFLEILKGKGIMKQVSGHIGIRNAEQYTSLLNEIGFREVRIIYLNHYLSVLKIFGALRVLPFIGKYFRARLLIIATKG